MELLRGTTWYPASRGDEWDANVLTDVIYGAIRAKFKEIFEHFPSLSEPWENYNLDYVVSFVINFLSLSRLSCYPGQRLLAIQLLSKDGKLIDTSLALKISLCSYLIEMFQNPFESTKFDWKAFKNVRKFSTNRRNLMKNLRLLLALALRVALLINDVTFIATGRNRRLVDFIFGLKASTQREKKLGIVSEGIARNALWQLSFRVLYVLIPLIMKTRLFTKLKIKAWKLLDKEKELLGIDEVNEICPECNHHPVMPCEVTPCKHVYCYICIFERFDKAKLYFCAICLSEIEKYNQL